MALKKLNSKKKASEKAELKGEKVKHTKKKVFKSPSAFSVLFIIIALMAG